MKLILLLSTLFLFYTGIFSQQKSGPIITFDSLVSNYGFIPKNSDGRTYFKFTNKGDEPLLITGVKSSCGCLVPKWPREPILPGETNVIEARYDTKRIGKINKSLTVISNDTSKPRVVLRIKGEVFGELIFSKHTHKINIGELNFNNQKKILIPIKAIKPIVKASNLSARTNSFKVDGVKYSLRKHLEEPFVQKVELDFTTSKTDTLSINLQNLYGNIGLFKREFFIYMNCSKVKNVKNVKGATSNSYTCIKVIIEGNYTGNNIPDSITKLYNDLYYKDRKKKVIFKYENNKLIDVFTSDGCINKQ